MIITDKTKVKGVLTRGVENIFPSQEALEKVLLSGKRIRLYCGFDPSMPSLHIGNAVLINKLSQFQELGHDVIFLIGDFTGMIGDPTDKSAARKKMTRQEVRKNSRGYKKQASGYLSFSGKNPARVLHNSQWSDKITFKDLIDITSNFTVQQMIQRDMFQDRMKEGKPIFLHEFLYPVAQGYDSVGMNTDLEIGGNDQMFNMLCGRDLIKVYKKKEKFVLTMKLLADEQGRKMGKSEGNAVFLDQTPEDMYGACMSWPDGAIASGFELATKVPMAEVEKIRTQLNSDQVNPRDLKMRLAFEMVRINHGEDAAATAQNKFITIFQKKEIPKDIEELELRVKRCNIIDLIEKKVKSRSEAKRLVGQGAIKIDGQVITDINCEIDIKEGTRIKIGKRQLYKVKMHRH